MTAPKLKSALLEYDADAFDYAERKKQKTGTRARRVKAKVNPMDLPSIKAKVNPMDLPMDLRSLMARAKAAQRKVERRICHGNQPSIAT